MPVAEAGDTVAVSATAAPKVDGLAELCNVSVLGLDPAAVAHTTAPVIRKTVWRDFITASLTKAAAGGGVARMPPWPPRANSRFQAQGLWVRSYWARAHRSGTWCRFRWRRT